MKSDRVRPGCLKWLKSALLLGVVCAFLGLSAISHAQSLSPATKLHALFAAKGIQSRVLWLERPQSGESIRVEYARNGILLRDGYLKACLILRDVRANKVHPIDPGLLEVLSAIQSWLALQGVQRPIIILSGYRTEKTNDSLEGAARNSYHLKGMAADIRIDGVPSKKLAELVRLLSDGGVGVYQQSNFIHIDTGDYRNWKR